MLLLGMKLELTSAGEPPVARLQPHACIDEINQEIVFDVTGGRGLTVAKEIFNYNGGTESVGIEDINQLISSLSFNC